MELLDGLCLMGLTPHCVTYCCIVIHMLIRVKMWSDWLFLSIKEIVKHCSVDSSSPETFSSALACPTPSPSSPLAFSLIYNNHGRVGKILSFHFVTCLPCN